MSAPRPYQLSVLIVDRNRLARRGLQVALAGDAQSRFRVVGETADISLLAQNRCPDLIITDPRAGDALELSTIAAMAQRAPTSRVVVFTDANVPGVALEALRAGARGYLLKEGADESFVCDALTVVGRYGAPCTDPRLYDRFQAGVGGDVVFRPSVPLGAALSAREREVLALIAAGLFDEQIAVRLSITTAAVRAHVSAARGKLGATTRAHLMVIAGQIGLLPA